jgi:rhodanese-related sulfurtransferase
VEDAVELISPRNAFEKIKKGNARLIDVRTPAEYRSVHAVGAENHELSKLNAAYIGKEIFSDNLDKLCILICKTGSRSSKAAEIFQEKNIKNVFVVAGGTDLWNKIGLPVEKGKSVISLERQVRIVAGALVFAGTLLGVFVNLYLLIIPGVVGAGLVFAGITDTCAMGLLLAKMPWNK